MKDSGERRSIFTEIFIRLCRAFPPKEKYRMLLAYHVRNGESYDSSRRGFQSIYRQDIISGTADVIMKVHISQYALVYSYSGCIYSHSCHSIAIQAFKR